MVEIKTVQHPGCGTVTALCSWMVKWNIQIKEYVVALKLHTRKIQTKPLTAGKPHTALKQEKHP